jgi:hypothetical protein
MMNILVNDTLVVEETCSSIRCKIHCPHTSVFVCVGVPSTSAAITGGYISELTRMITKKSTAGLLVGSSY